MTTPMQDPMWEEANTWAIAKLADAGYTAGDALDVQRAQRHLLLAALACPTLIDREDDGGSETA